MPNKTQQNIAFSTGGSKFARNTQTLLRVRNQHEDDNDVKMDILQTSFKPVTISDSLIVKTNTKAMQKQEK